MQLLLAALTALHRSVPVPRDDGVILTKVVYPFEGAPVVLFLSGANCPHESYSWLATKLAAETGTAVVLASYVDETVGCLLSVPYDLSRLASLDLYKTQTPSAAGIRAILDDLARLPLDISRVAIGGHSTGGRSVLDLVAFGCENTFPEIRCAFTYGASFVNGPAASGFASPGTVVRFDATHGASVPLLLVGGDRDAVSAALSEDGDATETLRRTIEEARPDDARLVFLKGATHMVLCDPIPVGCVDSSPPMEPKAADEARDAFADLVAAFLSDHGVLSAAAAGSFETVLAERSPEIAWRDASPMAASREDLETLVRDAQLAVAELGSQKKKKNDKDILRVKARRHSQLGTFMASKPSLEVVDGGVKVVTAHWFLEPEWTSFDRPLGDGNAWTYAREAGPPTLAIKLKRRDAIRGDAERPDPDAATRVNRAVLAFALGEEAARILRAARVVVLEEEDRVLEDDPDGPFGNKGGKYIESSLTVSSSVRSPTILTPLDGVPEPFRAQHYVKVLSPAWLREWLVRRDKDDSRVLSEADAWAALRSALNAAVARVVSALRLAPSARVPEDHQTWTAGSVRGTIAAWEGGKLVDWAVRYLNEELKKTDDSNIIISAGEGLNVWLSDATDCPHLACYVSVRRGTATLILDHVARRDAAADAEYRDRFYATSPPVLERASLAPLASKDPRVRAARSPNAVSLTAAATSADDVAAMAAALNAHVDEFLRRLREEEEESKTTTTDNDEIRRRDAAIRTALRDHEADAGRQLFGSEDNNNNRALDLANTMAGFHRVVGGGLGGLAAGIALRKVGCEVSVLERNPKFLSEGGTGLTLWPNGLSALWAIDEDLYEEISRVGTEIDVVEVTDASGANPLPNPTGDPRRFRETYGRPMRNARWSRLHQVLAARFAQVGGSVLYDRRLTWLDDEGAARFVNSDGTETRELAFDAIVGADGLKSRARELLVGDAPRDAGRTIWRAVIPFDSRVVPEKVCSMSAGAGKVGFVTDVGDGLLYWSAFATDEARTVLQEEDVKALLHAEFDGVAKLRPCIEMTPAELILERRVADRAPLVDAKGDPAIPWGGRVTLLGDAMHAMIPSLGQGANSAFEGAYRLAANVKKTKSAGALPEALRAYERDQMRRVSWIVESSARQGRTVYEDKDEFMRAQQAAQDSMWGLTFPPL
ncbi:hypothetical protein CTAYLR_000910 [Chrysophaeum taylorii]|uniref:FAD-binding domain-containing protein n=1 Tax=Chrysophaeum taylorii TaxID=2483200 RepID=A0AAD7UF64_9STRA|nr:hypothetical protein CTAYLR_000910 [Chrysophaeum taylorii]